MGCRFSSLSQASSAGTRTSGVRRATPRRLAAASRTASAVTTLALGARLGGGLLVRLARLVRLLLRRCRRLGVVLVLAAVRPLVLLHYARHVDHQVARRE